MPFFSRSNPQPPPTYENKLLIAIMGATGSGKSSFMRLATGKDVIIGHDLESCTADIQEIDVQIDEKTVTLIDTPGFDDTNKSDTEILTVIANYLESSYRQNHRLTGVIFLHRITDNRMTGVSNKNVLMFQKLVGNSVLDHVICCSTMWDRAEASVGEFASRENQLGEKYWANMIANGAQMVRHDNTAQSARSILAKLVFKKPITLEIQWELVDEQKKLSETSAGVEVNKEIDRMRNLHQNELKETKEAYERMRADDQIRMAKLLAEEIAALERKLVEEGKARAKLDEDRRAEVQKLQDKIARMEAKEAEAREKLKNEIATTRVRAQDASFGVALQIPYEPSNSAHQGRTIYEDVEERFVRGSWEVLIARGNWSTSPISCSVYQLHDSPQPDLSDITFGIYMYRGDTDEPAFVWASNGRFWPGFTKIGMVSADMSERMGSLEKVQNQQAWRLELDIHLSVVSNSLMAWVSYERQGCTWSTEPIEVVRLSEVLS